MTILRIPATIAHVSLAFSPIPVPGFLLRALCALSVKIPLSPLRSLHSFARSSKIKLLVFNFLRTLQKEYFSNCFTISNFRTLLKNTGGVHSPATRRLPAFSTAAPMGPHSNSRKPIIFIYLLHDSLDSPGGGVTRHSSLATRHFPYTHKPSLLSSLRDEESNLRLAD